MQNRMSTDHVCSERFDTYLCNSVSSILAKQGIQTSVIEPVYYYQQIEEGSSATIDYVLVCYGHDSYANVTYTFTNDMPVITCVQTGLRLNDLESKMKQLNTKIDIKNYEQSVSTQRINQLETHVNSLQTDLNTPYKETLEIILPPIDEKKSKNKKCLLIVFAVFLCLLLVLLIIGLIIGLLFLYYRPHKTSAIISSCSGIQCFNGATCQSNGTCLCSNGFTGAYCEKNQCYNNNCYSGSTCQPGSSSYTCACPDGYSGVFCQNYNPCYINRCLNKGTCQQNGTSYNCVCPQYYTGDNCEIFNPCCNSPCANGATCQASGNSYVCICPEYFSGTTCHIYTNACLSTPCLNRSTCKLSGFGYVCICPIGFSGINCQSQCNNC